MAWEQLTLEGIAGSGGFATTYLATHPEWGQVAVKVLAANWAHNVNVGSRFTLECETLADARPEAGQSLPDHVPGYLDHGIHEGAPYLVTEFCAGGSLEQRLGSLDPELRVPVALWLLQSVLPGLSYIHQELGVVHRDLSPGNLLMRETAHGEQLVIADFGLLKQTALQSNLSQVLGTAGYAAPEVRTQGVCDERSDLYSVGVMAWEILTGRQAEPNEPFEPDSLVATSPNDPHIPDGLAALVLSFLQTDRDARPWIAEAASAFAELDAATAQPPPAAEANFVRPLPATDESAAGRGPLLVGLSLLVLAALGAIAYFGLRDTGPDFIAYEPEDRGVVLELQSDWQEDPEAASESTFFVAGNAERNMVLALGTVGAADPTIAIELVADTLTDQDEILDSGLLDNGNGSLRYRSAAGTDTQFFFASTNCGTLALNITSTGQFSDDDVDHLAQIGQRLEVVDRPVLSDREQPAPTGFTTFSLNGVALAAPDSYYRIDAPNHCLFVIDDVVEHTRSVSVSYYPAAEVDSTIALTQSALADQGMEVLGEEADVGGFPRLHMGSADGEFVMYFVSDGAGVYVMQASEFLALPLTNEDLASFDQVAATFRVTA